MDVPCFQVLKPVNCVISRALDYDIYRRNKSSARCDADVAIELQQMPKKTAA